MLFHNQDALGIRFEKMKRTSSDFHDALTVRSSHSSKVSQNSRKFNVVFITITCCLLLSLISFPFLLYLYVVKDKSVLTGGKWFHIISTRENSVDSLKKISFPSQSLPTNDPPEVNTTIHLAVSEKASHFSSGNEQWSVIKGIEEALRSHPFHQLSEEQLNTFAMEDYFVYLSQQPQCQDLPIFTSMANIFSELYWQL